MDWDKLKAFYTVSKVGSISKACQVLHISQSALSRQIKGLESRLNTILFERHKHGVLLTEPGKILFKTAEKVVKEIAVAESLIVGAHKEAHSSLSIATTIGLSTLWLVPLLKDFYHLYPKIDLSVIGYDGDLDLKTHQADVAIRPRVLGGDDLIQEYLMTFHVKLFASPAYIKEWGMPQTVDDLDNHRLITYTNQLAHPYTNINWALHLGKPTGEMRNPFLRINSNGLLYAVMEGLGIAAFSKEYGELKHLGLVPVLPEQHGPKIDIYYVYPRVLSASKEVMMLGDFLKKKVKV